LIYFARKPDAVFTALLDNALDVAPVVLRDGPDAQPYPRTFPSISRWVSRKKAIKHYNWLQGIHVSPVIYRISNAAMQLVYDALAVYIAYHNETVRDAQLGQSLQPLGRFMIGPVDPELVFDSYFWNEAFLDVIPAPGSSIREVERIDQPSWVDDAEALFRSGSTRYPDPRSAHDTFTRRDGAKVVLPLPDDMRDALLEQRAAFREKFGRNPGPGDPMFWDPDADEPAPVDVDKMKRKMVDAMKAVGTDPAMIFAFEKTGMLPTAANLDAYGPAAVEEWEDALREYERMTRETKPAGKRRRE
jgi:hypothetical protein